MINTPTLSGEPGQAQLTGPDYLLGAAQQASERGQPFADEFARMVWESFGEDDDLLIGPMTAKRPLREYEASPASIILGALELATSAGDKESSSEVVRVGLALLAKWPSYLAVQEQHPSLTLKSV